MSPMPSYGPPSYTLEGPRGGRYAWTLDTLAHPDADQRTAYVQAVLMVFWNKIDQRYTIAHQQVTTWTVLGTVYTDTNRDVPTTITHVDAPDQTRAQIRAFAREQRDLITGTEAMFTVVRPAAQAA